MKKLTFFLFIFVFVANAFAQNEPPLVNINRFIKGGEPREGNSRYIELKGNIRPEPYGYIVRTYCFNKRNDYGYLFTSWELEGIYSEEPYPTEYMTVPAKSVNNLYGYPIWVTAAFIEIPDNVKRIDFEEGSFVQNARFTINPSSKIKEIHIPKVMKNFEVQFKKGFTSDVVFYIESDNPGDSYQGKFATTYYANVFDKCVFIVPQGSVEKYKKIPRFKYARIFTSIDDYHASLNHKKIEHDDATSQTLGSLNPSVIGSFNEGMAMVMKNGKWGYIDKNLMVVIRAQYDEASDFKEGLAVVGNNGKYGFVDKSGNVVIPLQYDYAASFSEGLAVVEKDELWGYIDTKGNAVIPIEYIFEVYDFSEGLAAVIGENDDYKYSFIDKSGKVVIPPRFIHYDNMGAAPFSEGLAAVYDEHGKYGYIDKNGALVIPIQFEQASLFSEGMAAVSKDGKWGYINRNGDMVVPMQYEYAGNYSEGLAAVKKNNLWGFINKEGKVVIDYKFQTSFIPSFHEGLAVAIKNNKCGYINRRGEVEIPILYDYEWGPQAQHFSEGLAAVRKDNKWFFIDRQGNRYVSTGSSLDEIEMQRRIEIENAAGYSE